MSEVWGPRATPGDDWEAPDYGVIEPSRLGMVLGVIGVTATLAFLGYAVIQAVRWLW